MLSWLLSDPQILHAVFGVGGIVLGYWVKHSTSPVAGRVGALLAALKTRREESEAAGELTQLLALLRQQQQQQPPQPPAP